MGEKDDANPSSVASFPRAEDYGRYATLAWKKADVQGEEWETRVPTSRRRNGGLLDPWNWVDCAHWGELPAL